MCEVQTEHVFELKNDFTIIADAVYDGSNDIVMLAVDMQLLGWRSDYSYTTILRIGQFAMT